MADDRTQSKTTNKTVNLMGRLKAPMTITAPTWAYTAAGFLILVLIIGALD